MATKLKKISEYNKKDILSAKGYKFGIVVSEWNSEITEALLKGAYSTLIETGAKKPDIITKHVPGSFELPLGAQSLIEYKEADVVICLGCIIQGETRHFEFICNSVSQGIMNVNLNYGIPVVFGVLTTDNLQQAKERSGGKYGNKGIEAAVTAIKMLKLLDNLLKE